MHQTRNSCHFVLDMLMMMEISVKILWNSYTLDLVSIGKNFYNEVTEAFSSFALDLKNCRGQGYDGAGAVSGYVNEVSALILRENSKVLYTHCASHRFNLVISTSCNFMDVINDISYFLNFSSIRTEHSQNFIKKYDQ